jgi:hypothetical protein
MKQIYVKPIIRIIHTDSTLLVTSGEEDSKIEIGDDITPGDGNVWGDSKHHDFDLTDFVPFQYDDEE